MRIPERFRERRRQLQELRIADREFHDLWEDYTEILHKLMQSEELNRIREELEKEIDEALGKR
ncbi:MAG: hypothetical protein V7700_18585 [Halioglobus sp.]